MSFFALRNICVAEALSLVEIDATFNILELPASLYTLASNPFALILSLNLNAELA
jgi:hypothetical protein